MAKVLVIESVAGDAERFRSLLACEGLEAVVCTAAGSAETALRQSDSEFALTFLSADIAGPPFGMELILLCRKVCPQTPVVVVSGALDAGLAARAAVLGARNFLEKPLDAAQLRSCLRELMAESDPLLPMVDRLREVLLGERGERLLGDSPVFLDLLRQVARVIPHQASRVLLLGESGTGKELIAKAIHRLGPHSDLSWVAINIGETPSTLVEDALFGHEKGAFTGARDFRKGLFEEAGQGTLFLDEIGDLELPLQSKLLRVIQEREFRRLGGNTPIRFEARLISATNRDLAGAVQEAAFRRDLYHRIAEVVIHVPPLRERHGDVDRLLFHLLDANRGSRNVRFSRETLAILRSYTFPGNVRELENLVKGALFQSDDEVILPKHLPLESMFSFLKGSAVADARPEADEHRTGAALAELVAALQSSIPANWLDMPYRNVAEALDHAFDRVYLKHRLDAARHNITRAAASSGLDTKTFRKHWKESGLAPLAGDSEDPSE